MNAVGLVLKAAENRVSDRLRCIFDSVLSVFGKDMKKNTVALITHSDGRTPKNTLKALKAANIKCAKDKKNQPVHFLFNFQAADKMQDTEELQHADAATTDGLRQFTDFLEKTPPQQLTTTMEVLSSRFQLTACIKNLKERAETIQLKQKKIQQAQEALKKIKQEMKNSGNVTEEKAEDNTVKVPVRGGNRWWGCGLFHTEPDVSTASSRERPAPAPITVKRKTSTVKKTIEEMREKYGRGKGDCESRLENLEKEMEELQKEKDQMLDESFQHVANLEQIALNVDSLSTHVHLDFLIEKMKEKGDAKKVKKLEEMKSRVNKGVVGALRYKRTAAARAAMKKTNASWKNKHIVSKSDLIQSGSPAVYQLRPKKEEIGSLRRMTLGEKDLNQTNRTILLVGETGAGKSTLVNTLVNYTMGVKWEDDVWFQIVEEEKRNQSESQTSDVFVYQIFGCEGKTLPYSLTIIDTPGYEYNRGTEQEDVISQRLFDLFRSDDGVHEINAVGLVLKATENRLDDRLMYIFDSVVSLFGKNMEQNIVALITHSDGLMPENSLKALKAANIKCAKDENNQPVHFLFDNCQSEQKTQRNQDRLKSSWDLTSDEMGQFTDFLDEAAPQKLMTTVEVLNTRIRLKACIQNLQERIELTELKQREIQQTHDGLKKHEEEMKNNENFTLEIDVPYREKESCKKGATCCKVCKENCHDPCTLALSPKWCDVMKKGGCIVCTRKCPVSDHEKEKKVYVNKTVKVQMDLKDVREKYERSKANCEKTTSLLETLEKEMKEVTAAKYQMLDESFHHVVNLQQIALTVDSLSTLVHLDFLIEKMEEKGDTEKIQKLEEMKRRVDERTRAADEEADE
ncbi:uncharacterized protein LOC119029686 [Acanthopagrus latus]|uniref:uncharacterized protein LOC119029686 n=1 Tax=Acanthopagrus latus TaxID=8177 RepID=UPI00187CEE5C|nr:uncharacterized protein LOC119029686 [Acanthopagrus latus]XP_036972628.1 uncharacterized protein LOC119029686 [Acanthopagrus latus]